MSVFNDTARVTAHVARIMFRHPDCFSISAMTRKYATDVAKLTNEPQGITADPLDFYIVVTLETRIGLACIVKEKLHAIDAIWWQTDSKALDALKIACVKTILAQYTTGSYMTNEERNALNSIPDSELIW